MGRLGTYVRGAVNRGTLLNSPHFSQSAVQGYDDYNDDYAADIEAHKRQRIKNQSTILEGMMQVTAFHSYDTVKVFANLFGTREGIRQPIWHQTARKLGELFQEDCG